MTIRVNKSKCIGCGACESVCPKAFEMDGNKAEFIGQIRSKVSSAIEICPVNAIEVRD